MNKVGVFKKVEPLYSLLFEKLHVYKLTGKENKATAIFLMLHNERSISTKMSNTVYIGFCDQPPSEGSGSLNPKEVAKSSGFQLDITTRRSQNTGWWLLDHSLLDIATNTGCYLLHKRQNLRSLNTRSLFMY